MDGIPDIVQIHPYIKEKKQYQSPKGVKAFAKYKQKREEKKDDIPNQGFFLLPVINLPCTRQNDR
jgi:hypothetical protein